LSADSTTAIFTWNTTDCAKGNRTISAYMSPFPDERHISDNTFTDGSTIAAIPSDADGDFGMTPMASSRCVRLMVPGKVT
jgi:hypothetical protein